MKNLILSMLVLLPAMAFAEEPSTTISCTRVGSQSNTKLVLTNDRYIGSKLSIMLLGTEFNSPIGDESFDPRSERFIGWGEDKTSIALSSDMGLDMKLSGIPRITQKVMMKTPIFYDRKTKEPITKRIEFTGSLNAVVGNSSTIGAILLRCELIMEPGSAG
jgi:hypothetical protein